MKKDNLNGLLKQENGTLLKNNVDLETLITEKTEHVDSLKEEMRVIIHANKTLKEENFNILDEVELDMINFEFAKQNNKDLRERNMKLEQISKKYNELNAESKLMKEKLEEKVAKVDLKSFKIVEFEDKIQWLENEITFLENVSTENKN